MSLQVLETWAKPVVHVVKEHDRDKEPLNECKPFLPPTESADIVHAATCLETGATLITNDKDFQEIRKSGKISVLSISEAIRTLL